MVKRILMVAYHFPPLKGSSGLQRTLKFSNYLHEDDWQTIVLTANPRAYNTISNDQLDEINKKTIVKRAFALDTARHLSIRGAYPDFMGLPDRWISWWFGAVPVGLRLINKYKPNFIFSTYPIATAHLIGLTLHKLTGLPWIADFRDSMTEENYPSNPRQRKLYRWIENQAVTRATKVIFTTEGTANMYASRYPEIDPSKWVCIANGYDEENFLLVENMIAKNSSTKKNRKNNKITLIHSGILYPLERNPIHFFQALRNLRDSSRISSNEITIYLRATGHDEDIQKMIEDYDIGDLVIIQPSIAYLDALAEMMTVDGLLIFQASNCNHQIPAKVYEYMRAKRPILALTDETGDTAGVMRDGGINAIVPLDNVLKIETGLLEFINDIKNNTAKIASPEAIDRYSRKSQAKMLANLLTDLTNDNY